MIYVDSREDEKIFRFFVKMLEGSTIGFEKKMLEVGDVIDENKSLCIERKTIPDFINSFTSHHLQNQLINMRQNYKKNFLCIIGDFKSLYFQPHFEKFTVSQKIGMFASLSARFPEVNIVQLPNDSQYVLFIKKLLEKLEDDKVVEYKVEKFVPKDEDIITAIVCQVPGIGYAHAKEITKKYESLPALQYSLDSGEFELDGIGKKRLEALRKYLCER